MVRSRMARHLGATVSGRGAYAVDTQVIHLGKTLLANKAATKANVMSPAQTLASNTICALQTIFCGMFRSRTSRSNRSRSAALIEIRSIFPIGADSQVCVDL